jgi:hypothetical protein
MKNENTRQPDCQPGVENRKTFVKPELRREAKLPKITNVFVGSFGT